MVITKIQEKSERNLKSDKKNISQFKNDIRHFLLLRSYDVVSQGSYRRFLLREKDLQEQWAIEMHQSFSKINTELKQVQKYQTICKTKGFLKVSSLLHRLSVSADPPDICSNEVCRCHLTSVVVYGGVRVSGKSDLVPSVVVHRRFEKFCYCFWLLSKIEGVLKSIIKSEYAKGNELTTTEQIEKIFRDERLVIQDLTDICFEALQYMHNTMNGLMGVVPSSNFFE